MLVWKKKGCSFLFVRWQKALRATKRRKTDSLISCQRNYLPLFEAANVFGGLWAGTHRSTVKLSPVNKQVSAYTGRSTGIEKVQNATTFTQNPTTSRQNPKPLSQDPTTSSQNPKPLSQNPKPENQNPKPFASEPKTLESESKTRESDPNTPESEPNAEDSDRRQELILCV